MCEGGPPVLSLGRLAELWRVIRMCEGGPPVLSLGRLAELCRAIRMFECAPSTSRLLQLRDACTRGCLIFDYCRLGLGIVRTMRAGFPAAIE